MKNKKKFISLLLSAIMIIGAVTPTFALEVKPQSKIIMINNKAITEEQFKFYLSQITPEQALVKQNNNGPAPRMAAAAAVYFIPGIGEVAILVTGVVVVGGIAYGIGSWISEQVKNWVAASAENEAENALKEIPNKLKESGSDDTVDLGKFKDKNGRTPNDKNSGEFKSTEDGRFTVEKDTAGHTGYDGTTKMWKLFKNGKRIASLNKWGKVVGK